MSEIKKYMIKEEIESYDSKSEFMAKLVSKFRSRIDEKIEDAFKRCKSAFVDELLPNYDRDFHHDITQCFQEALEADYYNDAVSVVNKGETALVRKLDEKVGELESLAYSFDELVRCLDGVQISANIATTNYLNKKTDDIKIMLEAYKHDRD